MNNFELFNQPKIRKKLKNISNLSSLNILILDKNNQLILNIGFSKNLVNYLKTTNIKSRKDGIEFFEYNYEGIAYFPIYFNNKKKLNCFISNFSEYSTLNSEKKNQINCFIDLIKEIIYHNYFRDEFTDKKRIEKSFNYLLHITQYALLFLLEDKIIELNKKAEKLLGYKRNQLVQKSFFDLFPKTQKGGLSSEEKIQNFIKKARKYDFQLLEIEIKRKNGTTFLTEISIDSFKENNKNFFVVSINDKTRQQLLENKLKSEEFFRNVIDTLPNFIFVKDYSGKYVLANKTLSDYYGTTTTDIIGKTDRDFNTNTEEVIQFLKADQDAIESGLTKIIHEESVTSSNKEIRWYKTIKIPLKNDKGVFDRVLGLSIDITNTKIAMEAIRETQERFKTLANKAPVSIIYFDKDGIIQFVNDYHLNKIVNNKVDKEYFIGRKINNIAFYKSSEINIDFETVLKGEFIELNEIKIPNYFDGKDIYLNIKAAPINKNGNITGGIIINEIVTDEVNYKKKLITSENRYKAITDVVTDVIISIKINKDLTAIPEWITKGIEKITGCHDYDTRLNENWIRLVHPDDIKIIRDLIKTSIDNEMSSKIFRLITKNNNIRWLQIYTNPYFSKEENRVTYVYVALKDITDTKKNRRSIS